jgi:hypothetical protein
MTGDIRELLPLYALGILEADEAALVERAVAGDATLAAELAAYQQTTDALGTAIVPGPGRGTSHYLICLGDEPCMYASRATDGIAIGGVRARPAKN